jgi:chromosome segregation ATPase
MKKETCSLDYEAECVALKEELDHIRRRLNEAEKIVCELTKKNETLKVAYDEQYTELIRCEAQIEAFKFVISEGR